MSWLRLDATYFHNPTIIRAGWEGAVVFLAAMTMSKMHGWDGAIPKDEFDEMLIRRHLGCHSDIDVDKGIASCVRVGLLTEDPTHYAIRTWRKFQPDPTAAERQRRSRANRTGPDDVTVTNGDNRESRTTGRDVRDVRDVRTDVRTPAPTRESVDFASQGDHRKRKRATPKQRACAAGILDELAKGSGGVTAQQQALAWRRLDQAGALDDGTIHDILDRWLKRFPQAAANGKKKATA